MCAWTLSKVLAGLCRLAFVKVGREGHSGLFTWPRGHVNSCLILGSWCSVLGIKRALTSHCHNKLLRIDSAFKSVGSVPLDSSTHVHGCIWMLSQFSTGWFVCKARRHWLRHVHRHRPCLQALPNGKAPETIRGWAPNKQDALKDRRPPKLAWKRDEEAERRLSGMWGRCRCQEKYGESSLRQYEGLSPPLPDLYMYDLSEVFLGLLRVILLLPVSKSPSGECIWTNSWFLKQISTCSRRLKGLVPFGLHVECLLLGRGSCFLFRWRGPVKKHSIMFVVTCRLTLTAKSTFFLLWMGSFPTDVSLLAESSGGVQCRVHNTFFGDWWKEDWCEIAYDVCSFGVHICQETWFLECVCSKTWLEERVYYIVCLWDPQVRTMCAQHWSKRCAGLDLKDSLSLVLYIHSTIIIGGQSLESTGETKLQIWGTTWHCLDWKGLNSCFSMLPGRSTSLPLCGHCPLIWRGAESIYGWPWSISPAGWEAEKWELLRRNISLLLAT